MAKNKPAEGDYGVTVSQVDYILEVFGGEVATHPPDWGKGKDSGPVEFLYRRDHLLVRDQDVHRLPKDLRPKVTSHPVPGLSLVNVRVPKDETLIQVLERIDAILGPGTATPDHLLSITLVPTPNPGTHCPATEPVPVEAGSAPVPAISTSRCDGRGVLVAVPDTGWLADGANGHPWLRGVDGVPEPETAAPAPHYIPRYTGHGTFIAGVIRAMAPRASVWVERIFERAGANFESEVVTALYQVMDMAPDVISLSAGTHTWLDRGLLSFRFFINGPLRERRHSVLVAAAGNDGLDWKFSPAKMKGVLSVGALSASEESRAWFSNHGDWVKVYAPGENLVQAYAHGTYKYLEPPYPPPARFDGMALWSGTSFSTPVVSGLIAARMSGTGETAHEAARALLRLAARQALPGVGAVLRPGQACLPECGDPAECGCSHHGGRCHDRRG